MIKPWKRNDPIRAIDPGHDPRDDEDHSGETEEDRDSYDDDEADEPDCADYEWDPIETP
jgi:hypothetical protein